MLLAAKLLLPWGCYHSLRFFISVSCFNVFRQHSFRIPSSIEHFIFYFTFDWPHLQLTNWNNCHITKTTPLAYRPLSCHSWTYAAQSPVPPSLFSVHAANIANYASTQLYLCGKFWPMFDKNLLWQHWSIASNLVLSPIVRLQLNCCLPPLQSFKQLDSSWRTKYRKQQKSYPCTANAASTKPSWSEDCISSYLFTFYPTSDFTTQFVWWLSLLQVL